MVTLKAGIEVSVDLLLPSPFSTTALGFPQTTRVGQGLAGGSIRLTQFSQRKRQGWFAWRFLVSVVGFLKTSGAMCVGVCVHACVRVHVRMSVCLCGTSHGVFACNETIKPNQTLNRNDNRTNGVCV